MNLRHQLPVCEVSRIDDALERVDENIGIVAVVESPLELLKIAIHVLDAHLVECPREGTLEQAPHALHAVRVNVAHDPHFLGMVHRFMARIAVLDSDIGLQLIRVDGLGFILYGAADEIVERATLDVRDALDANLAAALDGSRNPRLVALVGAALALLLAAYQCLIDLHDTQKRGAFKRLVSHRFTNAVAEIPCRSVGDPERSLHLASGNAFLGFAHQVDRDEPFAQGQVGIVHDGSAHHRELVSARAAFPAVVLRQLQNIQIAATGATHTRRPSDFFKCLAAFIVIREFLNQGHKVHDSKAS